MLLLTHNESMKLFFRTKNCLVLSDIGFGFFTKFTPALALYLGNISSRSSRILYSLLVGTYCLQMEFDKAKNVIYRKDKFIQET